MSASSWSPKPLNSGIVRSSLALGPMARNISRYRSCVRLTALVLAAACSKEAARPAHKDDAGAVTPVAKPDAAPAALAPNTYPDLPAALAAIIPADARVIGFGELHARTD